LGIRVGRQGERRARRREDAVTPRRFIYGPVPSRRLGRSLGVDLVTFKLCMYESLTLGTSWRVTSRVQNLRRFCCAEGAPP